MKRQLAPKLVGFLQSAFVENRAFQKNLECAWFHRLFEIPEGFEVVNDGQRFFDAAECGEHNRRSVVAAILQVLDQLESVHARHNQIRNNDVRAEGAEPFQRVEAVRGNLRYKAAVGKNGRQRGALGGVIIYYKDAARSGWRWGRHFSVYQAAWPNVA